MLMRLWIIGFAIYVMGVLCVKTRVEIELKDNPDFIEDIMGGAQDRDEALGNTAPYICAIFPGLNLVVGILLIIVCVSDKIWETVKTVMLDKN